MSTLYHFGLHLIPCGGEDGKRPRRSGWNNPAIKQLPLQTCLEIMQRDGSATYGIRLDHLVVVDCDTDNETTIALVRERFSAHGFSDQD